MQFHFPKTKPLISPTSFHDLLNLDLSVHMYTHCIPEQEKDSRALNSFVAGEFVRSIYFDPAHSNRHLCMRALVDHDNKRTFFEHEGVFTPQSGIYFPRDCDKLDRGGYVCVIDGSFKDLQDELTDCGYEFYDALLTRV